MERNLFSRSGAGQTAKQIFWEFVGSILIAIGIYNFAVQAEFPMTGFSGIAIIIYRLFDVPIGFSTVLLNIPVALLCCRLLGKRFFVSSIRCMLLSSFIIDYVAPLFPVYEGSRLLAALCTGIFAGLGYALIYISNSSTGGSDFITMAVKKLYPHIPLGNIVFLSDASIILLGGLLFRDIDGVNLSYKAECPTGWTDWNASLEIVAAAGKEIGIDISTYFPDTNTFYNDLTTFNFDIAMNGTNGASVSNPWGRAMQLLSSSYNDLEINWSGNWGHYENARADELLALIPHETDEAVLKEYYTELSQIYLTDVPSVSLMYRPQLFYAVNETVWTNYPEEGDDIPPTDCTDGYGVAALYELQLVNP